MFAHPCSLLLSKDYFAVWVFIVKSFNCLLKLIDSDGKSAIYL